jgi:hypothetical protein
MRNSSGQWLADYNNASDASQRCTVEHTKARQSFDTTIIILLVNQCVSSSFDTTINQPEKSTYCTLLK